LKGLRGVQSATQERREAVRSHAERGNEKVKLSAIASPPAMVFLRRFGALIDSGRIGD
jgi:hypothetical protein